MERDSLENMTYPSRTSLAYLDGFTQRAICAAMEDRPDLDGMLPPESRQLANAIVISLYRPRFIFTPNMARRGSMNMVGRPKFGLNR